MFLNFTLPILDIAEDFTSVHLPSDTILDMFKLEAFADAKLNVAKMIISPRDRVEHILEKGENAGY